MDIRCFKDTDPLLFEHLTIFEICFYEEKRYRHALWDELKLETGVEIQYLQEDDMKRKKYDTTM